MRIMAITAFNGPVVNPVTEGRGELRFDVGVAPITKLRLSSFQKGLACVCRVDTMTIDTAHAIFAVSRVLKRSVFALVAAQAHCIHLLGGSRGEIRHRDIAAFTSNVFLPRSVAA